MKTVIAFLFITVPFVKGQAPPQPPIQLEFVDKNLRLIDTADESKEMLRSTRYFKSFDAATNFNWTFQIEQTDTCYKSLGDIFFTELVNALVNQPFPRMYHPQTVQRIYPLCEDTEYLIGRLRLGDNGFFTVTDGLQWPIIVFQPHVLIDCGSGCMLKYAETNADEADGVEDRGFVLGSLRYQTLKPYIRGRAFTDRFEVSGVTFGSELGYAGPLASLVTFRLAGRKMKIKDSDFRDHVGEATVLSIYHANDDTFAPKEEWQELLIRRTSFDNNTLDRGIYNADVDAASALPIDHREQNGDEKVEVLKVLLQENVISSNSYNTDVGDSQRYALIETMYQGGRIFAYSNCFDGNVDGQDEDAPLFEKHRKSKLKTENNFPLEVDVCPFEIDELDQCDAPYLDLEPAKFRIVNGLFGNNLNYGGTCGRLKYEAVRGEWFEMLGSGRDMKVSVCDNSNHRSTKIKVFKSCNKRTDEAVGCVTNKNFDGCEATIKNTRKDRVYKVFVYTEADEFQAPFYLEHNCVNDLGSKCRSREQCCYPNVCFEKKCKKCRARNKFCGTTLHCCPGLVCAANGRCQPP